MSQSASASSWVSRLSTGAGSSAEARLAFWSPARCLQGLSDEEKEICLLLHSTHLRILGLGIVLNDLAGQLGM